MHEAAFGWRRAAVAGLAFRPVVAETDLPFLQILYASTRTEELAQLPWSEAQKSDFLDMQFRAQHEHYRHHFSHADWLLIEHDGEAVGRLYLDRRRDEHRIIDIAFLPLHRGRGFGSALLADLLEEAAAAGKATTIHVEKFNPAMRLYHRLGFVTAEDKGVYDLMRWTPPSP